MEYRVLARKYRPTTFDDLVGQEVLVRTLANAFKTDRIAHAFLLTGIRGIGKTTTARIIARALNCIGPDGNGGPTTNPCGVCDHCKMIGEDRHPDVLELDAASRTGVDDIRELIDSVRYLPSSARTKVYIIDEVHMLSTSAFNALLKTLEEPPAHVKFIFATTEARKIPVTILSRCQRFDLKRLDTDMLADHLGNIAQMEAVQIDQAALKLIGLAAEGSVRDGLSLLDQAIAHHLEGQGSIGEAEVRHMLGLADRSSVLALLTAMFKGEPQAALTQFGQMYHQGADPLTVIQDCLELLHFTTRIKLAKEAADDPAYSQQERDSAKRMADELAMPVLTRAWQMLLKGLNETKNAPSAKSAAEMVLVRVAYAAELPTPAEAIRNLESETRNQKSEATPPPTTDNRQLATASIASQAQAILAEPAPASYTHQPAPEAKANPTTMQEVVSLFDEQREALVASQLREYASLVSIEAGKLEIFLTQPLGREFTQKAGALLSQMTGQAWNVVTASAAGEPTLAEQERSAKKAKLTEAAEHPTVSAALKQFPGAELVDVSSPPENIQHKQEV